MRSQVKSSHFEYLGGEALVFLILGIKRLEYGWEERVSLLEHLD